MQVSKYGGPFKRSAGKKNGMSRQEVLDYRTPVYEENSKAIKQEHSSRKRKKNMRTSRFIQDDEESATTTKAAATGSGQIQYSSGPVTASSAAGSCPPGSAAQETGTSQLAANCRAVSAPAALEPQPASTKPTDSANAEASSHGKVIALRYMPIDSLMEDSELADLFERSQGLIENIAHDMRQHGFQENKPVIITMTDEGPVVIDGYTRLCAARLAGLKEVPIYEKAYSDFNAMKENAMQEQLERRNLSKYDLLLVVQRMIANEAAKAKNRQGKRTLFRNRNNVEGTANKAIAAKLHIGTTQVAMLKKIAERGDEKLKNRIRYEDLSIEDAYDLVKEKRSSPETETASGSEAPKTSACSVSTAASEITAATEKKNKKEVSAEAQAKPEVTMPLKQTNMDATQSSSSAPSAVIPTLEVPMNLFYELFKKGFNGVDHAAGISVELRVGHLHEMITHDGKSPLGTDLLKISEPFFTRLLHRHSEPRKLLGLANGNKHLIRMIDIEIKESEEPVFPEQGI